MPTRTSILLSIGVARKTIAEILVALNGVLINHACWVLTIGAHTSEESSGIEFLTV